ncbi:MAG TPA: phosphatase PAP2 family protein [Acidobacteriaceae bacterium]|jgi:membrane-associated phospholipid phosphatase|nr:phosphatase PAP2 family protein [Acidobacteriaceae bacterium]
MTNTPQSSAVLTAAWQRSAERRRFNIVMAVVLAVLVPSEVALARHVHFVGSGQSLQIWTTALFLGAILAYCRWRPLPKLVEACELAIWTDLYFDALSVVMQIAGRSRFPLVDERLRWLDAHLHFSTASAVHWVAQWRWLHFALNLSYALEPLMLLMAVIFLPFMGHAAASRRYALGIVVAAFITAGVFALVPAAGPWTTEGYKASRDQAAVTAYLTQLKTSAPVVLDMKDAGIVAFPSFHVLLALLSAIALSSMRRLRVAAWALALLICVSTLTTGWHYLTDVFGGILLTLVSVAAARFILTVGVAKVAAPQLSGPQTAPSLAPQTTAISENLKQELL